MPEFVFSPLSFFVSLGTGLAASLFLYYNLKKKLEYINRRIRLLLIVLRALAVFLTVWLLWDVYLVFFKEKEIPPKFILLLDHSSSIYRGKDSGQVKKMYEDILAISKKKSLEGNDIKKYLFGAGLRDADSLFHIIPFTRTNASEALRDISDMNEEQGAYVLLISDGIWNEGPDPKYEAFPGIKKITTVGIGDTLLYPDMEAGKIRVSPHALPGEEAMGELEISARQMAGKTARIRISRNQQTVFEKNIPVNAAVFRTKIPFQIREMKPGTYVYKLEILSPEPEKNTLNNVRWFSIVFEEKKYFVGLVYSYLSPDLGSISETLRKYGEYEMEMVSLESWNRQFSKIPTFLIVCNPGSYTQEIYDWCVQKKISAWFLQPSLPFRNMPFDIQQLLPGKFQDAEPILQEAFDYFKLEKEYSSLIQDYPALLSPFGSYSYSGPGILFKQKINGIETNNPLMVFEQRKDGIKFVWTLGEGIWRWKMYEMRKKGSTEQTEQFFMRMVQFLKNTENKERLNLQYEKIITEQEDFQLRARFLNAGLEPDNSQELMLEVSDTSGKSYRYIMNREGSGYYLNLGKLPHGRYTARASLASEGKKFFSNAQWDVLPYNAELSETVARHDELRILSEKMNGHFFTATNYKKAIEEWLDNKEVTSKIYSEEIRLPPVYFTLFFFLIVLFFTLEWAILKYYGYI